MSGPAGSDEPGVGGTDPGAGSGEAGGVSPVSDAPDGSLAGSVPGPASSGENQPDPGSRGPRHRRRGRRRWRTTPWVLIAVGALLVAGVGSWQLYATLWTAHSQSAGKALVHQFLKNRALGSQPTSGSTGAGNGNGAAAGGGGLSTASLAACSGGGTTKGASGPVHGLLEIPKLGVVAPVEQGVGGAQLDVAVGHLPASVWPGAAGNAVLEAHDVSYFVALPNLAAGDTVRYVAPCTTYVFQVSAHTIVQQGSPVYDTPGPTMTLVTCWPTDALWFTPDRYLVTATEVSRSTTGGTHSYLTAAPPPSVPVPPALASQGVTLATYSLPMGTLALAGSPDTAWSQTTGPLLVEGSAVEAFIAGVRALTEGHLDWWHTLAPGVEAPAPLVNAQNPGYLTGLDVTVSATGAHPTSVSLTDVVAVHGGSAPGRYSVSVQQTIEGGKLLITSWTLHAA